MNDEHAPASPQVQRSATLLRLGRCCQVRPTSPMLCNAPRPLNPFQAKIVCFGARAPLDILARYSEIFSTRVQECETDEAASAILWHLDKRDFSDWWWLVRGGLRQRPLWELKQADRHIRHAAAVATWKDELNSPPLPLPGGSTC